jgi:nucleotidyltransferase/DNA polymerase involved in DNA repair
MTTLEALASRVDVYSIDEAFLDLTGIDRVVSFEPFGRQAIWLKVESPDGYVLPTILLVEISIALDTV